MGGAEEGQTLRTTKLGILDEMEAAEDDEVSKEEFRQIVASAKQIAAGVDDPLKQEIIVFTSVTADRVRDGVNLSSSDISDAKVTEFILDAEVVLESGLEIDYTSCRQAEAAGITDLAALYCLVYITGVSASGTSFTLGDLSVKKVTGGVESPSPAFLQQRVLKLIEKLHGIFVEEGLN